MIEVSLYKNQNEEIYALKVSNHAQSIVCAAVSVLVINTVNSIHEFTDADINFEFETEGGYIFFEIPVIKEGGTEKDAQLLLSSLMLGLYSVKNQSPNEIAFIEGN